MKNLFKPLLILILFALYSPAIDAQSMNKSKMINNLADTSFVHAAEIILQPGEKTDVHTHPAHFVYALTDCNLNVYYTDGKNETYEFKAGESGVSGPERPHATENKGKKTARFLIVEMKEHPYKPN
jgi:quercetin dioxygenase-like cupin family protein